MGLPTCRVIIPSKMQRLLAFEMVERVLRSQGYSNTKSKTLAFNSRNFTYLDGAYLYQNTYHFGGTFEWRRQRDLEAEKRTHYLFWSRPKRYKYVLCYCPKPNYCIHDVKCETFFQFTNPVDNVEVVAWWSTQDRAWILSEGRYNEHNDE